MQICSARMGFTVEDNIANIHNTKVLHLVKKESHRLTAAHCTSYNIIFDFSQQDYQVWSATEVHVRLLLYLFSENLLNKHAAP